jgi:hypothetical protein
MVTHCFSDPWWDLSNAEPVFLQNTWTLLKIIIPASICVAQWRLYAAKRRLNKRRVSTLGFELRDQVGCESSERANER